MIPESTSLIDILLSLFLNEEASETKNEDE